MKHSIKMVYFTKNHPPSMIKSVTKIEHLSLFCRFYYIQKWNTLEKFLLFYRHFLQY